MTKRKTKLKAPGPTLHLLTLYSYVLLLIFLFPIMMLATFLHTLSTLLQAPAKYVMRDLSIYNSERSKIILRDLEATAKKLSKKNAKTNK